MTDPYIDSVLVALERQLADMSRDLKAVLAKTRAAQEERAPRQ